MRYTTSALKATALALPLGFVGLASAEAAGVVETIQQSPRLSTFYQALQQAGLVEQIGDAQAVTVFAPTDEAFEALPDQTVQALLAPENQDALRTLLNYHVVEGRRIASTELPEQIETEAGTLFVGLLEGRPVLARSEARGFEGGVYREGEAAAVAGVGPAAGAPAADVEREGDAAAGVGVGRLAQPGDEDEEVEADLVQGLDTTSPSELQDEAPLAQERAADEVTALGTVGQDDTAGVLGSDEDEGGPETLSEMVAGGEQEGEQQGVAGVGPAAGAPVPDVEGEEEVEADLVQGLGTTSPSELQDEAPLAQERAADEVTALGTVGQDDTAGQQTAAGFTDEDRARVEQAFGAEPAQGAQIVEGDVEADNGVIHVIDYVLVPNAVIEAMLQ